MESPSFSESEFEKGRQGEKLMALLGRLEFLLMQEKLPDDFIPGRPALKTITSLYQRFKKGEREDVMKEAEEFAQKAEAFLKKMN